VKLNVMCPRIGPRATSDGNKWKRSKVTRFEGGGIVKNRTPLVPGHDRRLNQCHLNLTEGAILAFPWEPLLPWFLPSANRTTNDQQTTPTILTCQGHLAKSIVIATCNQSLTTITVKFTPDGGQPVPKPTVRFRVNDRSRREGLFCP
jgi:hypothetical protein